MDRTNRKCCNPLKKINHTNYTKLFHVTLTNIENGKTIGIKIKQGQFICPSCRASIAKTNSRAKARGLTSTENEESEEIVVDLNEAIGSESGSDAKDIDSGEEKEIQTLAIDVGAVKNAVNELLVALNLNVIDNAKLRGKDYQTKLMNEMTTLLNRVLLPQANPFDESEQMIEKLKDKFKQTTRRDIKVKILSIFPQSWSFTKFREVLGDSVSKRMVYQTKKLTEENGILCEITKKIGSRKIDSATVEKVHEFYRSEIVSRACPGIRDYVLHKANGEKEKLQRRLVLCNLKEAYQMFKNANPGRKIGFTKFAELRPKECVLAGSTHGIHKTCVCVYHQNVKLIHDSLLSQFDLKSHNIETLPKIMEALLCKKPTEECRLDDCKLCPGIDGKEGRGGLRSILFQIIDESIYEKISFKQWMNTGSKW